MARIINILLAAVAIHHALAHGNGPSLPKFMIGKGTLSKVIRRSPDAHFEQQMQPAEEPGPEKRELSTDGRCGTGFGTTCADNECCSDEGWCGQGYVYCSAPACQLDYGPACDANLRPKGPDTSNVPRPKVGPIPYGEAIYHCNNYGDIALSYDDGPYLYTSDLLDILKSYGAKATFFITGRNLGKGAINDPATPWPNLIRRMIADGHQIASHTWSHQWLTKLSYEKFLNQVHFNEIAFADILGYFPTYLRPPYSSSNATTDGWLDDLGYHVTYFNLDTEGYLHDSPELIQQSKDIWDQNVEGMDPATTKWLDIEHDPVYQSVYNLTGYMLESLFRNGFRSVTVGECLGDPRENWYRSVGDVPPSTTATDDEPTGLTTTPSTATGTFPPTTNGRCGFGEGDQTCNGAGLGHSCCSDEGWCGNSSAHCDINQGCQPLFGDCNGFPDPPSSFATYDGSSALFHTPSPSAPSSTNVSVSTTGKALAATATSSKASTAASISKRSTAPGCEAEPTTTTTKTCKITITTTVSKPPSHTKTSHKKPHRLPYSTNGRCGASFEHTTCFGEPTDKCCSSKNWCGSTEDHCLIDRGCQPEYGDCKKKPRF